jgi:CBS domain containing-hemolysin-like protein
MPDSDGQPPLYIASLAIALFSLLWQLLRARKRRQHPDGIARFAFWLGSAAWVFLGLLLRDTAGWASLPTILRWIIPTAGLIATSLIEWAAIETPRILKEQADDEEAAAAESGTNGNGEVKEESDLDTEDFQLLQRLISLLDRRAFHLMVPVKDVPHVMEDDNLGTVLDLMTEHQTNRIPVLDRTRTTIKGVIDSRELVPGMLEGKQAISKAIRAGDICEPIQSIRTRKRSKDAIDILRTETKGVVAVVDLRGRVVGFLAWQPIFRQILGKPAQGGLS